VLCEFKILFRVLSHDRDMIDIMVRYGIWYDFVWYVIPIVNTNDEFRLGRKNDKKCSVGYKSRQLTIIVSYTWREDYKTWFILSE